MKRIFLSGASSGIGSATAQLLTSAGHQVWGTSRDINRLSRTPLFHPIVMDLRQSSSVDTAFQTALTEAGHFDVLINNAGSGRFGPAQFLAPGDLADEFQVLFLAHVSLMQLALADMRATGSGLIINVTSLASRLPVPFMAAYNAAKAAMASFTMTTQLELPDSRIRIVDLQPADISTDFNHAVTRTGIDPRDADAVERTWKTVDQNMKAAPGPELVARRILQLVNGESSPARLTVGNLFQARIAPFIFRFIPQSVRIWGLKKYYRLS